MRLLTFIIVLIFCTMPAMADDFHVGAATVIITPDPLLPVSGGLGAPGPVKEKRGELTSRAVVFQKGDTSVAVVCLDLLGFPAALGNKVRAAIDRIPGENILIGATHGHSSPDVYAFPDGKGGHTGDLNFIQSVVEKTVESINAAIDNLQPASIRIATGEAKGKIAYNYYAPQLFDPRMSVIQAVDANDKNIVTLVNYAIHPEVLGNGVGILSPDLIGPLCDRIESETGGMAIFMNGAQGGMVTADNRDFKRIRDPQKGYWDDDRTWDECLRIGHLMADEAMRIVDDAAWQKAPTLQNHPIEVRFPVSSPLLWAIVTSSPLKYPHNDDQTISTQVNLVNLGNAQILTIPGEALPNIGYYLKRKMQGQHNLLFGLTNDAFGYILTEVDYSSFSRYDYVTETSLGEQTGPILIEKSLKLIKASPKPDSTP